MCQGTGFSTGHPWQGWPCLKGSTPMIAPIHAPCFQPSIAHLQYRFLTIQPRIERHARIYFRDLKCQHRKAEYIAETVGLAWKWFVELAQRGKDATEFASTLATFAARHVRSGRRVCGQLPAKDVLSEAAQQRHGFAAESLPLSTRTCHDELNGISGQRHLDAFEERLRDNTRTPPDAQAAFRIDFSAWLLPLTAPQRHIIKAMGQNERTKDLAQRFEVSPARISQMRREFHEDWNRFTADPAGT